ncbi:MAG TPA: ROK family protein, partial [Anaeromyxobacter sp.]
MAPLTLGVDLGGTNARAAVVDSDTGEIVAVHKEPVRDRAPAAVVEVIRHAIAEALGAAPVPPAP